MRHYTTVLAALFMIGCGTNPGTDRDSGNGPIGNDTDTTDEMSLIAIETSILGEVEPCAGTVEQDGEEMTVTTGDVNADSTTKLPVFLNEPFIVKPGNKAIRASDDSYLHAKNIDGVDTFWYSPEIEDKCTEKSDTTYVIEAPMVLHLQGDNVFCEGMSWWLDTSKPDHKGEPIGPFEEGPYEIIVSGYAEYPYYNEETKKYEYFAGAQILVDGEFGGDLAGMNNGGKLVMVDDIVFFLPENSGVEMTSSFAMTEEVELAFENAVGVTEATCYNFDASR